ncbi:MAG: ubiquinone biosynthesis protein [Gaiellales bacterium]|jgi:ubiquinone biosynthesis protein|nr:ubiquinone biosynthesis protein [Gaiellales bacterium]
MIPPLSRRRQIARVREIAQVAARHGFGYAFERRPRRGGEDEPDVSLEARGRHLREMLDELGPTFVKFGQLLSMRPDVIPAEIIAELRMLQDAVSPFPYSEVEQVIRRELKADVSELFTSFDPVPIAAASIGQVHLAELQTGRKVAVKVQRPNAPRQIEADIALLHQVARVVKSRVERLEFVDTVELVNEFARSIRRELDYRTEARNAEAFRRNFAATEAVVIPKVYWTYSSERVLTLERIEGTQLADLPLATLAQEERRRLAHLMAEVWLEMIFRHGMFHGDPHPANMMVLDDGRLGLVDFGITGSLSQQDMRRLTRLLVDAVNEDIDRLPRRLHDLGVRFNREQEDEFRLELREVYYRYHGAALGEIDPLEMIREAFTLIARMHMRLPTRFALLDKTLAALGSVGAELYPDFNVFDVAEPYAQELMAQQLSPGALFDRGRDEVINYGGLLMELPYQVHDTLEQLRDGEVEVQFRHKGLDLLTSKADVVFNRLVLAIVMSGTLIGAALIGSGASGGPHVFGVHLLTWLGVFVASGLGLILVLSIVRSGRL